MHSWQLWETSVCLFFKSFYNKYYSFREEEIEERERQLKREFYLQGLLEPSQHTCCLKIFGFNSSWGNKVWNAKWNWWRLSSVLLLSLCVLHCLCNLFFFTVCSSVCYSKIESHLGYYQPVAANWEIWLSNEIHIPNAVWENGNPLIQASKCLAGFRDVALQLCALRLLHFCRRHQRELWQCVPDSSHLLPLSVRTKHEK